MVNIVVTNLNEDASRTGKKFAREIESIAEERQIGVQPELPSITVGLNHLWFARHILVIAIEDVALSYKRLKIGAEFYPIRRIHVDHLHLTAHSLVVQQ